MTARHPSTQHLHDSTTDRGGDESSVSTHGAQVVARNNLVLMHITLWDMWWLIGPHGGSPANMVCTLHAAVPVTRSHYWAAWWLISPCGVHGFLQLCL
eukprot:1160300-Pelagomonas_calceolata.AAC.4